jgi:hypothetical protein
MMELIWLQTRETFGLTQAGKLRLTPKLTGLVDHPSSAAYSPGYWRKRQSVSASAMDLVNEATRAALADFDRGKIGSH